MGMTMTFQEDGKSFLDEFKDVSTKSLKTQLLEAERTVMLRNRQLNLVAGIACGLMQHLGLSWEKELAILCNFTGDFEEKKKAWHKAYERALERFGLDHDGR